MLMESNSLLRRLRFALNLRNRRVAEICRLGGHPTKEAEIASFLQREHEEGYAECNTTIITAFLDGLIVDLRGKRENKSGQAAPPRIEATTNNRILRKLRIALDLKEADMLSLLDKGGFPISKTELSALFRKESHKHYRECGDQALRYFIIGLTRKNRPDSATEPEE